MNTISVATFEKAGPALALKDRFENAGIHAIVKDESRLQRFGFFTTPSATQMVLIDPDEYEKACGLLQDWDRTDHVLDTAVRCPECRSARVEYPQFTRKFVTPIVVEMFVSMGLFPKEFYCLDCHYTWPREVKPEPDRDILGWPRKG